MAPTTTAAMENAAGKYGTNGKIRLTNIENRWEKLRKSWKMMNLTISYPLVRWKIISQLDYRNVPGFGAGVFEQLQFFCSDLLQQNVKKIPHQLNIPPRQMGCFSGVHCNTLHVFSVFNPLVGDCPIVQQGGRLQKLLIQWLEG